MLSNWHILAYLVVYYSTVYDFQYVQYLQQSNALHLKFMLKVKNMA